jgi:23S rRNA pseudouridine2605 synthase
VSTGSRQEKSQVTLARALSKLGICSRSQARSLIEDGKVRLAGKIVRDPDLWIDLRTEMPEVEGNDRSGRTKVYLAFHKPAGVVTTRVDERGRKTVYDLLPRGLPTVFPVGRLDLGTTGLLLFTNDGAFGERVTGPAGEIEKTYLLTLDRPLERGDLERLQNPMSLRGGTEVGGAVVRPAGAGRYEFTITEGKNRQIRRMCEALGYEVVALHRVRIGAVKLARLQEGGVRPLTPEEIDSFTEQRRRVP